MRFLIAVVSLACLAWPALFAQQDASCSALGNIRFVCGQQGPEDLVAIPNSPWIVASVFSGAGGINLIHTGERTSTRAYPAATSRERRDTKTYDTCPGPPDAGDQAKFLTHGLAILPGPNSTHTLFAVHHGARESIEVFEIDARGKLPGLTWIGCAVVADPIGLNSVVALPGGGFIASNFLARGIDAAARARMLAGETNGELWDWHTGTGWTKVPGSEAAGANGLEISKDGRSLYVAAWGSQSFFRLSRGQVPPRRDEVPLGFRVDNIRWALDGSILAVGQGGAAPMQTTNIVRIDPVTLKVEEIIRRPNTPEFGAGTVAVEINRELWVGSFRGDRIAIFRAP